jgi:hypothetical protein
MQNFQGFKKTASDHKSTTFEHPNGSKLIVAHSGLNPRTLEQISKLPVHKAKGENVQKYAGDKDKPEDSEVLPDTSQIDPNGPMPPIPSQIAQPGALPPSSQALANPAAFAPSPTPIADALKYGKQWAALPAGQEPEFQPSTAQPAADQSVAPTNVNLSQTQQPTNASIMPNYDPTKGINMQQAGNINEAKAVGNIANQQAAAFEQNQKDIANINYQGQQNAWNNKVETDNMIDDMKNSHIDPKAYLNNMSDSKRTATAVGLLLGGMGGGILHTGGNVAMDFLNKQIDRDVAAQQSNIENKKTIFNATQQQYGNQRDATNMTRAFYIAKLQNELNTAAAKSGSQIAMARAQQLNGPLEQQKQQLQFQVGMRQAAMNAMSSGTSAVAAIPYLVQDPSQQKEAIAAYGKLQELNKLHQDMRDAADHLHNKMMNGALSPHDTAATKDAFAGAIQKISEGRYNGDAAQKIVTSQLPQIGDVGEDTYNDKLNNMDKFFEAFRQEPNATLGAHFIPPPKAPMRFNKR